MADDIQEMSAAAKREVNRVGSSVDRVSKRIDDLAALVEVVARLLGAGAVVGDETGTRPLRAGGVAVGVTHRDQRAHVRAGLDALGLGAVTVDTANRLQGRQFEVTVMWHPLSGRRDAPVATYARDTAEVDRRAVAAVMAAERRLGRAPEEMDHNNKGFTMGMAGGGVKGGLSHGATDEYGYEAVEGKVHIHDWHATILHLLGLGHTKLTYRYAGRDFRLTDVHGEVIDEIVA